jgi:hypothetical protein
MSHAFRPWLDVLPAPQRWLWPQLKPVASLGFVLYGGTAIALRLGHRQSLDFDFFSEQRIDQPALREALPILRDSTVLLDRPDSWSVLVKAPDNAVIKLSFFGGIDFGRVGEPEWSDDQTLKVASFDDLMATKLKVLMQRVEAKDYVDIAAMLRADVDLWRGLSSARTLFGSTLQPSEVLKALVYFADGDLATLSLSDRRVLVEAVSAPKALSPIARRALSMG